MATTPDQQSVRSTNVSVVEYTDPVRKRNQRNSTSDDIPLLPGLQQTNVKSPEMLDAVDREQKKLAIDGGRWTSFLYCLPHIVPMVVTMVILSLNIRNVYWQDLGRPNQNSILQAIQYAAKAHEIMMLASLTAIVVYRVQQDLSSSNGVPFGFLTAGAMFSSPNYTFSKAFLGGATAHSHTMGPSRYFPLSLLLIMSFGLTLVVGPSSAVAMIPRLAWWDVPKATAFGGEYTDMVYFNWTAEELWPVNITNKIYASTSQCVASELNSGEYCANSAVNSVGAWIARRQNQGTPPNITIFQDTEITRFLTSQGGPPDKSSWTVTSTIGSTFARDLDHYWDWLVENSTLPKEISRPLLRPTPSDPRFTVKKPLVQVQCHSYFDPDYEDDVFEFPHNDLRTPPLDVFVNDTWRLPNAFVMDLKGNDSTVGNFSDTTHALELFEWFDTASAFATQGAPSLGAVILYRAYDLKVMNETLATCSIDGRWAPVEYSLDPKDTITIRQDSPNPMDIVQGPNKADAKELIQMKMSLDWAKAMNPSYGEYNNHPTTAVEYMLSLWGGESVIYTEPDRTRTSLDWRLSTMLGLYLTECLAYAFSDPLKASMLYRKAPDVQKSYIRYLDNVNEPKFKEGYRDGKLDWVEMRDPRWQWDNLSLSHDPWDVWAPKNGYSEITFKVQRNGYGYGFNGVTIKLATTVLVLYLLLALIHVVVMMVGSRTYKSYSTMAEMMALAWNSPAAKELENTSAGIERLQTWRHTVRVREGNEGQHLQLQLLLGGYDQATHPRPKAGVNYA